MMFDGIPALIPPVREGRLRALAVGSAKRVEYVPGLESVPAMDELLPGSGMDMEFWYSVDGPAGLPTDITARLQAAVVRAAQQPDYRERLQPLGFMPITDASPAAFTAYIEAQVPVQKSIHATIEHGHANHRSDNFYSVAYWYQSEPHTPYPVLPAVDQRIPRPQQVGGPGNAALTHP